jgi:hypothetical protein
MLNPRHVAFWTIVGSIAAVITLIVALTQLRGRTHDDAGSVTSNTPAGISATLSGSPSPSPGAGSSPTTLSPTTSSVALRALCNARGAQVYICGLRSDQTIQVGGKLFTYVGETNGYANAKPPNWALVLHFPANTCQRLVIQFARDDRNAAPGSTSNVQLLQSKNPAVTASASRGSVGTLDVELDGGPFDLSANATDGESVKVNGYALCASSSGL